MELTGFSPDIGFIHIDLRQLITTRIIYQEKRRRVQETTSRCLKREKRLLEKYSHRERDKCRDIERKIAVQLTKAFPNTIHGFEKLNKENMIRKRISRVSWRNIVRELKQRAIIKEVNPKDTSKTCSRCGYKVKKRGYNLNIFF